MQIQSMSMRWKNGILTIDVIRGKRRRKTAHTLALKDLEVIAPNWHESVAKYRKDGGTEKLKNLTTPLMTIISHIIR